MVMCVRVHAVDAEEHFARRHLPGAVYWDVLKNSDSTSKYPIMLPPADQVRAIMHCHTTPHINVGTALTCDLRCLGCVVLGHLHLTGHPKRPPRCGLQHAGVQFGVSSVVDV